jgi:hypothetical protein
LGSSSAFVHRKTIFLRGQQLPDDLVDLRVHQRLAAGDRHHRGAALLDRGDRLLHRHPLLEQRGRLAIFPQPAHLRLQANSGSSSTSRGTCPGAAASA